MTRVRMLVTAGVTAVLVGTGIIAVLHVVGPGADISPIRRTISEYGLTSAAWAFNLAVLAVAVGSALVLVAVASALVAVPPTGHARMPRDRASAVGRLLGALWVAGMITLVIFPKANWAIGPSVAGYVHRIASLVAFIALPVAIATLLRRATSRDAPGFGLARTAIGLALASIAWFVPIILAIVLVGSHGAWWAAVPLGLIERGMALTEIAGLVVLAVWATKVDWQRTSHYPVPIPAAAPTVEQTVTDPAVP